MKFLKNIKSLFSSESTSNKNTWTEKEFLDFRNNLLRVISWTDQLSKNFDLENGKYGFVFRQTNPIYEGSPLYKFGKQSDEIARLQFNIDFGEDYSSWNNWDYSFDGYDFLLNEASIARPGSTDVNLSNIDKLGRILSFQTCVTTHDGAPIIQSRNFLDEADVPPIDTWFYLKRNYFHSDYRCDQCLFCWIPKKFEEVMQEAIEVEILDSYRWIDQNDSDIYERLKNSR